MPELPEVETTRRGIEPHILHKTITEVEVHHRQLRWPISHEIDQLAEQRFERIERRAKYLLMYTQSGCAMVHLGMSGSLRLVTDQSPRRSHDHVILRFGPNLSLHYHDPRRFGSWLWHTQEPLSHRLLQHLGPEPLSQDFSADYLAQKASGKTTPIKPWLMNNRIVVGVGNIYASESLFEAGINPYTPIGSLRDAQWRSLCEHIKRTLQASIEQGGTTLRDFVNPSNEPGYFAQSLWVYGRESQACQRCTTPIRKSVMAQRASYWCPQCQPE